MPSPLVRYRSLVADSARWQGFAFRPGDIVVSTPAKCGTTWTQMICALLVFQTPDLPRPLSDISPWLDMLIHPLDEVVADLEAQGHRRIIKSHTPFDGLPFDEKVTYVCVGRDPRDAGLSMGNHRKNMDFEVLMRARAEVLGEEGADPAPTAWGHGPSPDAEADWFWAWVDDPSAPQDAQRSNLRGLLHHLATFRAAAVAHPNVVLLHFADLEADLEGEMRRLAVLLGIDVPEERWPELVRAATFAEMRSRADALAPDGEMKLWHDNREFFHRGRSGQWREVLDDAGVERYHRRVAELTDPAMSAWLHRG